MSYADKAASFREAVATAFSSGAEKGVIDEGKASGHPEMFEPWAAGVDYAEGDMRQSIGRLWRCLQAHTSQAGWEPESTPALWVEVAAPGEYREIKPSMLPTEAFALDEIGWWQAKDNLYRSLIDNNVYTPDSYPAGWQKI